MRAVRYGQRGSARLQAALAGRAHARRAKLAAAVAVAALTGSLVAAPPAAADSTTIAVSSAEGAIEVATTGAGMWCATTTMAETGAQKWTLTLTPVRPASAAIALEDRAEVGTGVCRTDVPAGIYVVTVSVTGRPTAAVELAVQVPQPTITPIVGTPGARYWHATAPIAHGHVLVTGGYVDGKDAPTQEISPSSAGMWNVPSPLVHRIEPALAALPDGRAVLIGGYTRAFDPVALIEVYSQRQWRRGGLLARPRHRALATTLDDGRVLVTGGDWTGLSAEIYDPSTGISRLTAPPPLYGTVAGKLADGRVLLTGDDSRGAALFDPTTEAWSTVGSTARPRGRSAGTLLRDGRYLLTGGGQGASYWADGEIFDPGTGTWTTISPMSRGRANHTATLLASGLVLVLGGSNTAGRIWGDEAQVYDPVADRWADARSADARSGHTVSATDDGALVVIGGGSGSGDRFAPRDLVYEP